MIKLSPSDLRKLADIIENREKYGSMCGVVYATIQHHPDGRGFLQFEQPCQYAECNSNFYRYEEGRI